MKNTRKERGVSLIELLVSVVILAVGLIPLVRVMMYGLDTTDRAHKMNLATNLARGLAEEIRITAFSEEVAYPDPKCSTTGVYPYNRDNAQCFGLESPESAVNTHTQGGRLKAFNDVDDYNGWCRGKNCPGSPPLETYDGYLYNGTQGYPPYKGFTRRVRIHNLDVNNREIGSFTADPFANYTSTDYTQFIKRFDFDNWTSLVEDTSGTSVMGRSPIKRIEVTVTYEGGANNSKHVEIIDVSYAVMPMM